MKTIGLIGGMSWESSVEYYRLINELTKAKLGGHHSAKSVMVSVDFEEIEAMQREDRWDDANMAMATAAMQLERADADVIVLCTNTMHICTPAIESATTIPFLHIADATAAAIKRQALATVAFLGTRYSMEAAFMIERLRSHELGILIPDGTDRTIVHNIIYEELVHGNIRDTSREQYLSIIDRLIERGAQGVILGCTEIGLLIKQKHCKVPVLDTTHIHAAAAVEWALSR